MEQRLGPAAESLQALLDEGHADSYDLAFIGAPLIRRRSACACMPWPLGSLTAAPVHQHE